MPKRLLEIIAHPAIISILFSVVIIMLLPPVFSRFEVEKISTEKISLTHEVSYCDLDGDGFSEKVLYKNFHSPKPIVTVYIRERIVDQWNFHGRLLLNKEFLYCDFDSDGTKEIFVFALENDSIFMYGINPLVQNRSWFYKKLVFEMEPSSLDDKPGIHFCDFPDINNDGFKEVVVAINAGFTLKPRNLFLIDIANNLYRIAVGPLTYA